MSAELPAPTPRAGEVVHVERWSAGPASGTASPEARGPAGRAGERVVLVRVADVAVQAVQWLWRPRIARGKLTILAGDPGLGKSQITAFLAAAVTTGAAWPAGEGRAPMGEVVMLSAEDEVADTIRPRLEAAGADVSRVHVLDAIVRADGTGRRTFDLAQDLARLDVALLGLGGAVRLVTVDPITAYLGGTDTHRTSDVRAVLAPLGDLAARHGAALVAVSHLNKGGAPTGAMGRVTGSGAFVAAARAGHLVVRDEQDLDRRLFLPLKNNLGPDRAGLAFRVEERRVLATDGPIAAPVVVWEAEPVEMTADHALAAATGGRAGTDGSGALGDAKEFLLTLLAPGPMLAKEVFQQAEEAGVKDATLRRAKAALDVAARRDGGLGAAGQWVWALPVDPPAPAKGLTDD